MLGPEHVTVRRKREEISIVELSTERRARALDLAEAMLACARALVGQRRKALVEALAAIEAHPSERRLADGLAKLVLDGCELSGEGGEGSAALRRRVFERAAELRRANADVDRAGLLAQVGAELGLDAQSVEAKLYADLKTEEELLSAPAWSAAELVELYERSARQALLLRAVRVQADVFCRTPHAYRTLFGKLKFRRLLHRIDRTERGYRIVIDGPYSLFDSVTKYGLALALVLPVLECCDELRLEAQLRWGPRRDPVVWRWQTRGTGSTESADLPDEVAALLAGLNALGGPWRAEPASELLDLPGIGVCAPDLTFTHRERGTRVHCEVLGFWSRAAVWKRVELAEAGLPEPVLFAVSSRLRVSEEVLDEHASGALYVYKGVMNPRAVVRKLDVLAGLV
jgi:predicted nuclease of restriction endonuclease-like RecB superfamily